MPGGLSLLSTLLSLVYNIMRLGRDFFSKVRTIKRDRKIKKEYDRIEDIVEDGDVDEINKFFKP